MTRIIVRKDGKKVLLDTEEDELIYDSKWATYRRTGSNNATRGVDLYARKVENENIFYLYHWSAWQGESCYIEEITQEEAEIFTEENIDQIDTGDAERFALIDMNEVL